MRKTEISIIAMIKLPDFNKSFEYENNFYLSCDITRISKLLAHYQLYKNTINVPGAIVECGVFKGASFSRFTMFRELFENPFSRKVIGFDTFEEFPETNFKDDLDYRNHFIDEAGSSSISVEQMTEVLKNKGIYKNIDFVKGDITKTVPDYVSKHPELKISLLNLDTDIYEPAKVILKYLYPKIARGGILILDDYGTFPGETKAADEYFQDHDVVIQKFPYCMTPSFIVKK